MTTFNWTISQLDCKPQDGAYTNVVVTAHWRCTGTHNEHTGAVYSTCSFAAPEDAFIEYQNLTLEKVLEWIHASGVDKTATEAAVQQQIDSQITPPIVNPPLPWLA